MGDKGGKPKSLSALSALISAVIAIDVVPVIEEEITSVS